LFSNIGYIGTPSVRVPRCEVTTQEPSVIPNFICTCQSFQPVNFRPHPVPSSHEAVITLFWPYNIRPLYSIMADPVDTDTNPPASPPSQIPSTQPDSIPVDSSIETAVEGGDQPTTSSQGQQQEVPVTSSDVTMQNDEEQPTRTHASMEERIPAKKDATLREFLSKMDEHAPIVSFVQQISPVQGFSSMWEHTPN
jgi:hypothetical protein